MNTALTMNVLLSVISFLTVVVAFLGFWVWSLKSRCHDLQSDLRLLRRRLEESQAPPEWKRKLESLGLRLNYSSPRTRKVIGAGASGLIGSGGGYALVAASPLTCWGAVGSGTGLGSAIGPAGAVVGALAGLAVYGIYLASRPSY